MTLSVDRRGMVAAVKAEAPVKGKLVGMRVEQAIQHTVEQLVAISDGDVEVRPNRLSSSDETAELQARIRTALPECEPPISVDVDYSGG